MTCRSNLPLGGTFVRGAALVAAATCAASLGLNGSAWAADPPAPAGALADHHASGALHLAHKATWSETAQAAALGRARAAGTGGHLQGGGLVGKLVRHVGLPATPIVPGTTPTHLRVKGSAKVLSFSADSTASYVLFRFDGESVGTPVAVEAGSATIDFPSWGYRNEKHHVSAVDCGAAQASSCNTTAPATTSVRLYNAKPQVTAPRSGTHVTGGFRMTAKSTGGGIEFLVDGRPRHLDSSAPYAFLYTGSALTQGAHTIAAVQCASSGSPCRGPRSRSVRIVSDSLHPHIVSVTPRRFSPALNGAKDSTVVTLSLPDRESTTVLVATAHGHKVRGPVHLGTLGKGRHSWTWNGKTSSGRLADSGNYVITLLTSRVVRGVTVRGQVSHRVTVDDRAPRLSGVSAPSMIFPVHDGYRDALTVVGRLSERSTANFVVRSPSGHIVDRTHLTHGPGRVRFRWNGHVAHSIEPGAYSWSVTIVDEAGNVTHTRSRRVGVSTKRLVTEHKTLTRSGASFSQAGTTDSNCASASKTLSQYKHGVWLLNTCFGESALAATFYRFSVPAAVRYSRVAVQAGGFTQYPPSSLGAAFGTNGAAHHFSYLKLGQVPNSDEAWWKLGATRGDDFVSSHHQMLLAVSLDSRDAPTDFDLGSVRLLITYQVLR